MKITHSIVLLCLITLFACNKDTSNNSQPTNTKAYLKVVANGTTFEFNEGDRELEFSPQFGSSTSVFCGQVLTVRKTNGPLSIYSHLYFSQVGGSLIVGTYRFRHGDPTPCSSSGGWVGELTLNGVYYQSSTGNTNEFIITKIENGKATGTFSMTISEWKNNPDYANRSVNLVGQFSNIPIKR